MAGTAADRGREEARARSLESNNHMQGRSGGQTMQKLGPASRHGVAKTNPTKSGGINRALQGMK